MGTIIAVIIVGIVIVAAITTVLLWMKLRYVYMCTAQSLNFIFQTLAMTSRGLV